MGNDESKLGVVVMQLIPGKPLQYLTADLGIELIRLPSRMKTRQYSMERFTKLGRVF